MSAVSSKTEIAKLALARIGADRITDLDTDTGRNSRFCRLFYDSALDEILRARAWNFATKRASLSQDATAPAFGWTYRYLLPSDFVWALEFNGKDWWLYEQEEYVVEDGYILSDTDSTGTGTSFLRYVYRNEDASKYPGDFVAAFACLLASKLAIPITGNEGLSLNQKEEYERVLLPKAAVTCAGQHRSRPINRILESPLVKARWSSTRFS